MLRVAHLDDLAITLTRIRSPRDCDLSAGDAVRFPVTLAAADKSSASPPSARTWHGSSLRRSFADARRRAEQGGSPESRYLERIRPTT